MALIAQGRSVLLVETWFQELHYKGWLRLQEHSAGRQLVQCGRQAAQCRLIPEAWLSREAPV